MWVNLSMKSNKFEYYSMETTFAAKSKFITEEKKCSALESLDISQTEMHIPKNSCTNHLNQLLSKEICHLKNIFRQQQQQQKRKFTMKITQSCFIDKRRKKKWTIQIISKKKK